MGRRAADHAVHAALSLAGPHAVFWLAARAQIGRLGSIFCCDCLSRSGSFRDRAVGRRALCANPPSDAGDRHGDVSATVARGWGVPRRDGRVSRLI